ncbi:MAG: glycosyltransferase [Gammaproteobacteria bacterium]|nr:glycosyltransferase [Gammaproteobacteria bacterium]
MFEFGLRKKNQFRIAEQERPLVTVITVVRNSESTIEQCMLSVLEQTYDNIEYIIIDGGSSDGTPTLLRRYVDNIDYVVSQKDRGIYYAMNKGLSLATGDYILFLNSDDWYTPDAVSKLINSALKTGVDVTHADAMLIENGQTYRMTAWLHDGLYTRGMPLRHETMLAKSEVFVKYGVYDTSYKILADYVHLIKLYDERCTFYHVREPLLYFRSTGVSYTDTVGRENERRRLFKDLFPFLDEDDLALLKVRRRLSVQDRVDMIDKHQGRSELFSRSMAYNIADCYFEEVTKNHDSNYYFRRLARKIKTRLRKH